MIQLMYKPNAIFPLLPCLPHGLFKLGLLFSMLYALGCAQVDTQPNSQPQQADEAETSTQAATVEASQKETAESDSRPFEKSTLYDLLAAELAAKDERLDITLGNYLKQAHYTKDPTVIARALRIAQYMRARQATLDAARLWLSVNPSEPEALYAAAVELMLIGRHKEAFDHIDQLFTQAVRVDLDFLLQYSRTLSHKRRGDLLSELNPVLKQHDRQPLLWFTSALIKHQQGDLQGALEDIDQTLFIKNDYIAATTFKANLLYQMEQKPQALSLLKRSIKAHPDNKRLHMIYARYLMEQQPSAAPKAFTRIASAFPNDANLKLTLALIAWENQANDLAKVHLTALVDQGQNLAQAHTYLGTIYAGDSDYDQALHHFQQIPPGQLFARAQLQIAHILYEQNRYDAAVETLTRARVSDPDNAVSYFVGHSELLTRQARPEKAIELLTNALVSYPEDAQLLYARALTAEKVDRLDQLEGRPSHHHRQRPQPCDGAECTRIHTGRSHRSLHRGQDLDRTCARPGA